MLNKIVILIIVAVIVIAGIFIFQKTKNINLQNQADNKITQPQILKLSILAFGDMMLDRVVYSKTQEANNFDFPFLNIDPLLVQADLRIANLEGPITDFKSVSAGNNRMRFTISPNFLEALKTRFEILSLANNHMLDFGEDGYAQTKEKLDNVGIKYFGDYKNGAENLSVIVEKNGIKIGFIGYYDLISESIDRVVEEIQKIKDNCDFIIIVPHWGNEYQKSASVRQEQEAKAFIDAGADLILGSHPHVVQNSEEYRGKMIFYSLGNFIFDQYFSQDTMQGLGVEILLEKSDNKIKADYKQHKILINKDSQPSAEN